jgi:hypothetical protein
VIVRAQEMQAEGTKGIDEAPNAFWPTPTSVNSVTSRLDWKSRNPDDAAELDATEDM